MLSLILLILTLFGASESTRTKALCYGLDILLGSFVMQQLRDIYKEVKTGSN